MSQAVRIANGLVVEIMVVPTGMTLAECYQEAVVAQCVAEAPDTVQLGWTYDGTNFAAPVAPPATTAQLVAYAGTKQAALATGGYTVTLSGQALTFETDIASRADVMGMFLRLAQPNPPATVNWQFAAGFTAVAASDFVKAASAIADFVQATYAALQAVLAAIAAGTITTTAQIDAAAWPSNVAAS